VSELSICRKLATKLSKIFSMITRFPGKPEAPPGWYRARVPSHIEEKFDKKLGDLADLIENEVWFGDSEKHSRYRVDFILKDARLIVELDGHSSHSTPEQLEKDAIRQRYLTRAGYTVIRFTGREINRDVVACVKEVRSIYKERMQRALAKYRVMYIDYQFLVRQIFEARKLYREIHPQKVFELPTLDKFIPHAIEWLHEKSFIAAFVFVPPEDAGEIADLDGSIQEYEKGEVRINIFSDEWYSMELGDHMMSYSHLFDEFYLVADDPVYVDPLRSVLPKELSSEQLGMHSFEFLSNGKLLRKCNEDTAFAGTDLAYVRWQDIYYPIGSSMGLKLHEL
jgi:very-short-patch-repair endonuclease